ncbi:MAG: hypothetical protein IJQ73_03545 [Kiritimatiellae bacterium]|nr:hypothetical protein [Kiritimatiellia bacterium]
MLAIVILFFLYGLLQKLIVDLPARRRIMRLHSTEEANVLRERVRHHRQILFYVFLSIVVLFLAAGSILADWARGHIGPEDWVWVISLPGFLWLYLRNGKNFERLMGNISILDKDRFLAEHDQFILFLRGFASDDYSDEGKLERKAKKLKRSSRFSEYAFTKILGQETTVCAIGMTKEISSPLGAVRIYVDDETWQQDVRDLMERAKTIYILVNDSSSCIWEICESGAWLSKSVLLVDDLTKYEHVRTSDTVHSFALPELPTPSKRRQKKKKIAAISFESGTSSVSHFDNTIDGYAEYLRMPPPKKERNFGCGWGCLCVAIPGLLLLFVINWFTVEREFNKDLASRQTLEEYKAAKGIVGELPILAVSEEISIVQPSGMELVESGTEQFSSLSQTVPPPFSAKAIYVRMGEVDSGASLSAEIADVSEWTNRVFSTSLEFKRQMDAERRELLSLSTPQVLSVSVASRTGLQWSLLQEECVVLQENKQSCFSMLACRMALMNGRCILFRRWQVFKTERAALQHAKALENSLLQWADASQAVNHKTRIGKKKEQQAQPSATSTDDKSSTKEETMATLVPLILVVLALVSFLGNCR